MTKTMTAEEVAEAVEQIRSNMEIAFDHVGKDEVALAWLSRLSAQAARVPGLEAEQEVTQLELAGVISERNAATENLTAHKAALLKLDSLLCLCTRWRVGDGGVEDPSGIDELFATFRQLLGWENREVIDPLPPPEPAEFIALRERVATLERNLKDQDDEHHGNIRKTSDHIRRLEEARDTAEARVKELEDALTAERAIHSNAQALIKALRKRASPTPPPGLREAVGPFVAWVRDVITQQARRPHDDATLCGRFEVLCTFGQGRALLAAYDATGGEDVHLADLRRVLEVARAHAAESMRERAAKECEAREAFSQAKADALSVGAEQGEWLIAVGEARHMARKIRAMPLEAP